jgi:hypothetical protein
MASVEVIALILTGLSISASIMYYASELRNQNKTQQLQLETRQTQIFMNLYDKFTSREMAKTYREIRSWQWINFEDFNKKYGYESNPEAYLMRSSLGSFFEGLGILVKRELVDISMVHNLLGISIVNTREKIGPVFKNYRTRTNNQYLYLEFEYLYNKIINYRKTLKKPT